MKKLILLVAAAIVMSSVMAQEPAQSYIQVNGQAEREIMPDEFYLSVVINERDSKGKISVESQQREMIAALRKQGVDIEKQLKVSNLSSEFFKKNVAVASAQYELKLGSAAEVAGVWQALDALGISSVAIDRVSHTQLKGFREEVRAEAMRNAQQTARTLAEAVGQKAGKCIYIGDSSYNYPLVVGYSAVVRSAKMADNAGNAESAPVLDFKKIKLEANVQARFVLE